MYYEYDPHPMERVVWLLPQLEKHHMIYGDYLRAIWDGYHLLVAVIVADEQRRTATIH